VAEEEVIVHRVHNDLRNFHMLELNERVVLGFARLLVSRQTQTRNFAKLGKVSAHLVLVKAVGNTANVDHPATILIANIKRKTYCATVVVGGFVGTGRSCSSRSFSEVSASLALLSKSATSASVSLSISVSLFLATNKSLKWRDITQSIRCQGSHNSSSDGEKQTKNQQPEPFLGHTHRSIDNDSKTVIG
jgi:hypothetical protein